MSLDRPFYLIKDIAGFTGRREKTLRNIISAYGCPKRTGWIVRRRRRQKVVLVRPNVARWLISVTLLGMEKKPGGWLSE
jgi:hypothetical protein